MNFELTQEQLEFQKKIQEFVEIEVIKGAIERDKKEDFKPVFDILINKMGSMGLLGLNFPKKYGGMGKTHVEFAIAMIEVCRKDVSVGASWSVCQSLGSIPILNYGSEEIKEKYLRPCLEGKRLCAFGLTEENAGSDAAMQETVAILDGDEYILNGKKIYITNASYAETYVVIAMTDKARGTKGISAFVVEKGTQGFTFGKIYEKCGIHATVQTELIFKDCRIPKENLLGKEGQGFKIAMEAIDVGRIGVAAQGVGCAEGAYDLALKRSKERQQFGKAIAENQVIGFKLAEMATKIELSKLILFKAAWLLSEGKPFTKEAAMAKKYCTNTAQEVATEAVQIMGGMGFLRENEVERFYRDSKILQIYEGTNQIQDVVLSGLILSGK